VRAETVTTTTNGSDAVLVDRGQAPDATTADATVVVVD
jgi:hypothetical protein